MVWGHGLNWCGADRDRCQAFVNEGNFLTRRDDLLCKIKTNLMLQNWWFILSTCFGHKYAHRQEYKSDFRFLVSKPGKPSGLCSAGLLAVCTVQRTRATSSEQHTQLTAQRYTTQTAFQVWTPKTGTHYCTPDDGHTCARNMLRE
jgi:hypothetical protein